MKKFLICLMCFTVLFVICSCESNTQNMENASNNTTKETGYYEGTTIKTVDNVTGAKLTFDSGDGLYKYDCGSDKNCADMFIDYATYLVETCGYTLITPEMLEMGIGEFSTEYGKMSISALPTGENGKYELYAGLEWEE